jgi:hypothetical protein
MATDLIAQIGARLSQIKGIAAVALGGSYARGTQRPDSDIDLGLYYREDSPFSVEDIKKLANEINDEPHPVVTDFGRWGPWVNGGAWLTVKGQRVDFLYRNLNQLQRVIQDCRQGKIHSDFYQQPPYGFHSYIYLGELNICKILHDPDSVLAALKQRLFPYPQPLKKAIIDSFLWGCEFDVSIAREFAEHNDIYNAMGCLTRCASHLVQVLYALNERYFTSDKGALQEIASFPSAPSDLGSRLERMLCLPGVGPGGLVEAVRQLDDLVNQLIGLCEGIYTRPDFAMQA